jgi:hypothetical protein
MSLADTITDTLFTTPEYKCAEETQGFMDGVVGQSPLLKQKVSKRMRPSLGNVRHIECLSLPFHHCLHIFENYLVSPQR